jgi:hypothetical protein
MGVAVGAVTLLGCAPTGGGAEELAVVRASVPADAGGFADAGLGDGGASVDAMLPSDGSTPREGGAGGADASLDAGARPDAAPTASDAGSIAPTCAAFDAGSAPDGAAVCGDGWRDPATEECDDGLGNAPATRRACSARCQVVDELGVWQATQDGGLANAARTLGAGRHPLAGGGGTMGLVYLQPDDTQPTMALATFGARGAATGTIVPIGSSGVVDDSNPVVAALPCGKYAVAWADFDSAGGDELDVALTVVDPSVPSVAATSHANTNTSFAQFDPDVLWTGSEVVVAWADDSNPATQPDLRVRTFDSNLQPTTAEQTLAGTTDSEADVALAAFAGSWAAAWRDDAGGLETIRVVAGAVSWTVGPAFLPAPAVAKPAITALDASHLLVVYAAGVEAGDSGVASGSQILAAVLNAAVPGVVTGAPVPMLATSGLDASAPAAATVQGTTYVGWWTAGAPGNVDGQDLWLKKVGWSGTAVDLTSVEVPLPRWPQARLGDQQAPAIAASALPPGGALAAAWTDLGRSVASGEGTSDVVFEFAPTPLLREVGGAGGP